MPFESIPYVRACCFCMNLKTASILIFFWEILTKWSCDHIPNMCADLRNANSEMLNIFNKLCTFFGVIVVLLSLYCFVCVAFLNRRTIVIDWLVVFLFITVLIRFFYWLLTLTYLHEKPQSACGDIPRGLRDMMQPREPKPVVQAEQRYAHRYPRSSVYHEKPIVPPLRHYKPVIASLHPAKPAVPSHVHPHLPITKPKLGKATTVENVSPGYDEGKTFESLYSVLFLDNLLDLYFIMILNSYRLQPNEPSPVRHRS